MWHCSIYSVGELWSDDYLQCNHRIEKNQEGEFFETYDAVYTSMEEIEARKEFIKDCIFRLKEELYLLNRFGDLMINKTHFDDMIKR